MTLNEVKDLVKNSIKQKKSLSYKEVVKIIADFYKIEEEIIYKKTRKKEVIKPRQIIMYMLIYLLSSFIFHFCQSGITFSCNCKKAVVWLGWTR